MNWLRRLFASNAVSRELVCVSWTRANRMLLEEPGWRIAPEEDHNHTLNMVYLERDVEAAA